MASNNKIWKYFDLCREQAVSKMDRRTFRLGALGLRNDGVMVSAINGPTDEPRPHVHAEFRLCSKLDHDAVVFVARVRRDGSFGMARPCPNCQRVLKSRQVKKVYFTISDEEYGIFFPTSGDYSLEQRIVRE